MGLIHSYGDYLLVGFKNLNSQPTGERQSYFIEQLAGPDGKIWRVLAAANR